MEASHAAAPNLSYGQVVAILLRECWVAGTLTTSPVAWRLEVAKGGAALLLPPRTPCAARGKVQASGPRPTTYPLLACRKFPVLGEGQRDGCLLSRVTGPREAGVTGYLNQTRGGGLMLDAVHEFPAILPDAPCSWVLGRLWWP